MSNLVHNKQLMLTASTVHCSLPSSILTCSVQLLGSAVFQHDLVLEPDYPDFLSMKSLENQVILMKIQIIMSSDS